MARITASRERFRKWRHRVYGFNIYNRRQWLARHASRLPAGARVLDVGAGVGQYRSLFAHCEYKAQDFGKEPQTIGQYTPLDFECDILDIPAPDESFDVILCTEVLEHVPEPIRAVHELARLLRPGGAMLLTAPLLSLPHQEPYHFYGGYTEHWYRRFLDEAGCDVVEIAPNQGFFSLYSDFTQWFKTLVHPHRTRTQPAGRRIALLLLWLVSFPMVRIAGPLGGWLDGIGLGSAGTVGYHVLAVRRGATPLIAVEAAAR
jgi:SAM-dependent methyltransferase